MSDKKKWPLAEAEAIAMELVDQLRAGCVWRPEGSLIAVAGSIRRRRPTVGDVEILYAPQANTLREPQQDMFAEPKFEQVSCWMDAEIARLEKAGVLGRRRNKNGAETWGEQNKLAVHLPTGVPVDLFATDVERWWTSLVIRTGGAATNKALAAGALRLGRKLHAYGAGVTMNYGLIERATSERHLFELCGVPYLEPEARP